MSQGAANPRVSVVLNFFNMRREAARTLFSLTTVYQRSVSAEAYEVIAIDNGSAQPLDEDWVRSLGEQFRYLYFSDGSPSPCAALNQAVRQAKADLIMCCIDGARILSPGVLHYTLASATLYDHPFVYTLGMHLGAKPQNILVTEGYNQQVEDEILGSIDWQANGYRLFNIACLALSSSRGFCAPPLESNCFALRKDDYCELGGFDENFRSAGAGLANLDFFNRVHEVGKYSPVFLLGEATFHQFHGGVGTNVPMASHPWQSMVAEYLAIKGKPYTPASRPPDYYGSLPVECVPFLVPEAGRGCG